MHRFFFSELGIHNEELPTEFTKYECGVIYKWSILRLFFYKEILQHIIPFILDIERERFRDVINDQFALFCHSKKCRRWKPLSVEEKALMLVTINTNKGVEGCPDGCCFNFVTPQARMGIWNDCCSKFPQKGCFAIAKMKFTKWLEEETTNNNTIRFTKTN